MKRLGDVEGFNEAWITFAKVLKINNFTSVHLNLLVMTIEKLYEKIDDTEYARSLELKELMNSIGWYDNDDGCYRKKDEGTEDNTKG